MKGLDFSKLPADPKTSHKIIDKAFENNIMDKEIGFLGKFFGFGESVKLNIAGICILILLLIGIVYTFIYLFSNVNDKAIGITEFWSIITPLMTLTLGYIFGKNEK